MGRHLVKVTEECLHKGIEVCAPNIPFKDIGAAIEDHAQQNGVEVIKEFIGHGIGKYFHGQPEICHYRKYFISLLKNCELAYRGESQFSKENSVKLKQC